MHKLISTQAWVDPILEAITAHLQPFGGEVVSHLEREFEGQLVNAGRRLSVAQEEYKQHCIPTVDANLESQQRQIQRLKASLETIFTKDPTELPEDESITALRADVLKQYRRSLALHEKLRAAEELTKKHKAALTSLRSKEKATREDLNIYEKKTTAAKESLRQEQKTLETYYHPDIYTKDIQTLAAFLNETAEMTGHERAEQKRKLIAKQVMFIELKQAMLETSEETSDSPPDYERLYEQSEAMPQLAQKFLDLHNRATTYKDYLEGKKTLVGVEIDPLEDFSDLEVPPEFMNVKEHLLQLQKQLEPAHTTIEGIHKAQNRASAMEKQYEELCQAYRQKYTESDELYQSITAAEQDYESAKRDSVAASKEYNEHRQSEAVLKTRRDQLNKRLEDQKASLSRCHRQITQQEREVKRAEEALEWWKAHADSLCILFESQKKLSFKQKTVDSQVPFVKDQLKLLPVELLASFKQFIEDDTPTLQLPQIQSLFPPPEEGFEGKTPKYIVFNSAIAALTQDGSESVTFYEKGFDRELPDRLRLQENEYYILIDPPSPLDCSLFGSETHDTHDRGPKMIAYVSNSSINHHYTTLDTWGISTYERHPSQEESIQFGGHSMRKMEIKHKRDIPLSERAQQLDRFCNWMAFRAMPCLLILMFTLLYMISQLDPDKQPPPPPAN